MTDEKFVFHEDVRERAKMKTGAMHKKGAKRVTNCKFPSDYLTKKEKEKMNGPVIRIKMNEPYYDWREFRKLPESLQIEYLQGLVNNYGARCKDLSEMFNMSYIHFNKTVKSLSTPIVFKHGGSAVRAMDERWLDFITKPGFEPMKKPVEKKEERKEIMPEKVEAHDFPATQTDPIYIKTAPVPLTGVTKLDIVMDGTRDAILGMLSTVLGTNCEYSLKINLVKMHPTSSIEVSFSE